LNRWVWKQLALFLVKVNVTHGRRYCEDRLVGTPFGADHFFVHIARPYFDLVVEKERHIACPKSDGGGPPSPFLRAGREITRQQKGHEGGRGERERINNNKGISSAQGWIRSLAPMK
jgi:hypothetical protein